MNRSRRTRRQRGIVGIPRVLNMYENYPFWFRVLYRPEVSGRTLPGFYPENLRAGYRIHPE